MLKFIRCILILLAFAVLAGVGYIQHSRDSVMSSGEIQAYHAAIRKAASEVPYVVADYVGEDIPVPQSAVELLRPNVILSRRYTNLSTGDAVDLLFVHCRDAQDMLGHHPPVCYPAHGWETVREKDLLESEDRFAKYFATRRLSGVTQSISIKQGLLLYGRPITPDMQVALRMSTRRAWRALGAGQVQLIVNANQVTEVLDSEFDAVVQSLAEAVSGEPVAIISTTNLY